MAVSFVKVGRKSATYKPEARTVSKYLIDNHVVWCNPADPRKVSKSLSNPTWEPVPGETACKDNQEILVSANPPSIGLSRVCRRVVMKGVHQGRVGKRRWPYHGTGPDQETANYTCHSKPKALGSDDQEHLESPAKGLFVEDLLCQKNISGIRDTALDRNA